MWSHGGATFSKFFADQSWGKNGALNPLGLDCEGGDQVRDLGQCLENGGDVLMWQQSQQYLFVYSDNWLKIFID